MRLGLTWTVPPYFPAFFLFQPSEDRAILKLVYFSDNTDFYISRISFSSVKGVTKPFSSVKGTTKMNSHLSLNNLKGLIRIIIDYLLKLQTC